MSSARDAHEAHHCRKSSASAATSAVNSPRLWPQTTSGGCRPAVPVAPGGHAGDQHRRLRANGFVQQFGRTLLRQLPQVVAQHFGSLGEGIGDHAIPRRQLRQHSDRLRALARKHETHSSSAKYSCHQTVPK